MRLSQGCDGACQPRYNSQLAHNAWIARLRSLRSEADPSSSERAASLMERWHWKGEKPDKARARHFFSECQSPRSNRRAKFTSLYLPSATTSFSTASTNSALRLKRSGSRKERLSDDDVQSTSTTPQSPDERYLIALESSNKTKLLSGNYLEDIVFDYGRSVQALDLIHWRIIEENESELGAILRRHGYFQSEYLPETPPTSSWWFNKHCDAYSSIKTVYTCRLVALACEDNIDDYLSSDDELDVVDPFILRWIDRAYEHVVSLLTETASLLQQPFREGAWEGVYWTILDLPFTNCFDLFLQRRDTPLVCAPADLTTIVDTSYRYDGVIRTREETSSSVLEFGLVEVSRSWEGNEATKWKNDTAKLYAGCRAMLQALKLYVDHDPETLPKLAVVGILQAGPNTMVFIMRCVGQHIYTVRNGRRHPLPNNISNISELKNVLASIFIARSAIINCHEAVLNYKGARGPRVLSQSPSSPSFL